MGTFILPANATVESLPKSIGLVNPEKTLLIKRQVQKSENIIQVNYIIEVNQTEFPADEYDVVKDFYKQMFDLLTEPVVVKYN